MSNSDDNYLGVLLEEIRDQNKAILEAVSDMQAQVAKLPGIDGSVNELKADTKVIKTAVTEQSKQLKNHESRITRLEVEAA